MGKLVYSTIASLDGYVADPDGNYDWGVVNSEVHSFVNELERGVGTYLYGRRMYEVMVAWETMETAGQPEFMAEFARIWRAAEKVVYSRTLAEPSSEQTRIEREFDPVAVRRRKRESERPISVGGPELAAQAFAAGLVDELQCLFAPIVSGGGTPSLPRGQRLDLELLEQRRFANGTAYLRYATRA